MTSTFVPCGAKLPVIALVAGAIMGGAWWMAPSMYFIGIASVIVSCIILKKTKMFAGCLLYTSILMGLKRKYTAYLAGSGEFPHELGVLLEYPVEDVRDFIRYNGDKCLFTGYWKVYHNPAQARAKFTRYDRAREAAMQQIINGCRLHEVAVRKGE